MRHYRIGRIALATVAAITLSACGTDPASPQDIDDVGSLQAAGRAGAGHGHGGILAFTDSLGLSDVQVAEIRAIQDDARARGLTLRARMREILGVPVGERPRRRDRAQLTDAQREALQPLIREMRALRVETRERTHAVLTDEQRTRLAELIQSPRENLRDRRGERRGDGTHRPGAGGRPGGRGPGT